jgi:uncharacterized protein YxeA
MIRRVVTMKKIVKIVLAAVLVVVAGLLYEYSIDTLDRQAEAIEENAEIIKEVNEQILNERAEKTISEPEHTEKQVQFEQLQVEQPKVKAVSGTGLVEERKKSFDESVVKETAFKLANSLTFGDELGKVEDYKNKEHIIHEYFMLFMNEDIARTFVINFFYDEIDGLHMIGVEPPYLLEPERKFTITKINEDTYQVTQAIQKESEGDASSITYEYEYDTTDNVWKISNITYQFDN